ARKPSVFALRPNFCASSAPAPAAASASTICASPVSRPLRSALGVRRCVRRVLAIRDRRYSRPVSARAPAAAAGRLWVSRGRDALVRTADLLERLPVPRVLAGLVAIEWVAVLATALVVRHAGWIYYQGGDQLWYYTLGWLLGHGQITQTPVGYGWS